MLPEAVYNVNLLGNMWRRVEERFLLMRFVSQDKFIPVRYFTRDFSQGVKYFSSERKRGNI